VQVTAAVDGDAVRVEVRDAGSWLTATNDDVARGRGLLIMRSVMDEVELVEGPGGTTVRLVRRGVVAPTG
jgi:anti-sigma regulatory factor (Ser/Thr protein kinase)